MILRIMVFIKNRCNDPSSPSHHNGWDQAPSVLQSLLGLLLSFGQNPHQRDSFSLDERVTLLDQDLWFLICSFLNLDLNSNSTREFNGYRSRLQHYFPVFTTPLPIT